MKSFSMLYCLLFFILILFFKVGKSSICLFHEKPNWEEHEIGWMGSFSTNEYSFPRNISYLSKEQKYVFDLVKKKVEEFYENENLNEIHILDFQFKKVHYRDYSKTWQYSTYPYILAQRYNVEIQVSISPKQENNDIPKSSSFKTHQIEIYQSRTNFHSISHIIKDSSKIYPSLSKIHITLQEEEVFISIDDHDDYLNINTLSVASNNASVEESHAKVLSNIPTNSNILNVVSYNIWNLNAPWQPRLKLLGQQLHILNPEIIGFEEVRFSNQDQTIYPSQKSIHQIDDLSNSLRGYQYVFQPAMTYLHRERIQHDDEGVAIFSRSPILESDFVLFTRNFSDHEDTHQRICLRSLVNTSIGPIHFFVTHFSLSASARMRNVLELWNFILKYDDYPQILVGDFNANSDSETIEFLIGKREINGLKGDFHDSWTFLNKNEKEGWTFTTLNKEPKKRIDFILFRGKIKASDAKVIENLQGQQPSDHRGLVASFILL